MKRMGIAVAAVLVLFVLPLSSQESAAPLQLQVALQQMLRDEGWSPEQIRELLQARVNWDQAGPLDAELARACWQYMEEKHEGISPEIQARVAVEVMTMAQTMRALGFAEQQIVRTALNGSRETLAELERLQGKARVRTGYDAEVGQTVRTQFEAQLQAAMYQRARLEVRERVREEKSSRPGDLLVPPGPQGPGTPGR